MVLQKKIFFIVSLYTALAIIFEVTVLLLFFTWSLPHSQDAIELLVETPRNSRNERSAECETS